MSDLLPEEFRLTIHMLGEFSIKTERHELIKKESRSKKLWLLISILLLQRGRAVPQSQLIELLWRDADECIDPANSLKNLVYRARLLLEELSPKGAVLTVDYIQYAKGSYAWNESIPCEVDTEEMESLAARAADSSQTVGQRIACYTQAITLYTGPFLPNLDSEEWILARRTYFEGLYVKCVLGLSRMLEETGQVSEVISVCEQAVRYCPFQEDIHRTLLEAYISSNQHAKALAHYQATAEAFNRELGVGVSRSIRELYQKIVAGIQCVETDLNRIKKQLMENSRERYAFFCEFPVFQQIVRVQMYAQYRSRQSQLLVLLTIADREGEIPPLEKLKNIMLSLQSCILDTLRSNDVVSRYSPSQFILGLMVAGPGHGEVVVERIRAAFGKRYHRGEIQLCAQIANMREEQGADW